MFDLRSIRENPDAFDRGMARRGLPPLASDILDLDQRRRSVLTSLQEMQQRRNDASKEIGLAKRQGRPAQDLVAEVAGLKERIQQAEEEERELGAELEARLAGLPNILDDVVPEGPEENNVEVRRWGDVRPPAAAREHFDLGEALGLMDFEAGAKLSGSRFTVLRGALARMERALGQFMLDLQTGEFGYTEISPPLMVRDEAMFGTGQLPKFTEDLFRTTSGHWLIPTAEVPLSNLVADDILDSDALPLRVTALTPCFRAEAGAAGKDTRGMIRQHQFWKVELVNITTPEASDDELERMTEAAETVLKRLELPYRTVLKAAGDTGFSARKSYDIEVWLPGQAAYREISSCSNCGDFQARRMKARYRAAGEKQTRFVHSLNGSGLAVGRCLIAVMENFQQSDGSVVVPEALRPYMGGLERIG